MDRLQREPISNGMKVIKAKDLEFISSAHEDQKNPGVYKKILVSRKDNIKGIVQMVNWSLLPQGKSFQPHFHEDMTEIFIILNGEAEIHVDDEMERLSKGDAIIVDPKSVHKMKNIGSEDVEHIVVGVSLGDKGKTRIV